MPSQDLIFPLLPRIPAPQPLGQNDLAAVGALTKRPVIEEEWDKKKPVQEDAIFDPRPGEGGGEAASQQPDQQADGEQPATAEEQSGRDADGHIDTFA
ncbi:MAG: hypothetical protein II007_04860 [Gammaproteobacteria bacterium]|nr:hypothetical protein [Gammaproteobacteria bacterium]